ncbi:malignant fibrous histiocytoma-amplified sequence 1 homolog [Corticium candelabrum]|uniref:malignant fibrous histiocytoma-amplified sequence 1 homolog n=1 Tax=Corticium candelabrum TaxID=121492 RepID=UPI002E266A2F|nr:malignant fibrous histiocytoma-amplified sequence 1 homolog [Corticium candelabrum]
MSRDIVLSYKSHDLMALPHVEERQLEMFLPKVNELNRLELDLLDAHLFAFPEEICETSGLEVLKLCTDDIHSIPEGIAKLRKLEEIHLHTSDYHNSRTSYFSRRLPAIGVQEVPTVVSLLPCLKVLSVCGNRRNPLLFDELMSCQLPSTLVEVEMVACGLTKLKELILSGCNIQQLPAELKDLLDLEELDLSEIKLEVFPTVSCLQWKHLQTLNLSGNKRLLCLPNNIWNGLNLWRLDLSNCGIESVPNTEVTIEEVDISGTSVTHLPKEFVFSSKLEELSVDGCPLVFPPIEVCNQGIRVIREYFRELDKVGGVRRGRIKILVMGTTMAGKTSFVEALESGKPFLAEADKRTIGVVEKVMKLDDKIECKLLDSGGHRAYMLTNQLFISDNSLVLIVVDSNQYKFTQQCFRQNIADFLQVVYDRNSRAHIAIVVSKVDLMVDTSREEMSRKWSEHLHTRLRQFLKIRQAEIDRMKRIIATGGSPKNKYVSERLHFFDFQRITVEENVLLTSAATHEGVVSVKVHLRELCGNERLMPSLHTELPSSWVTVEDKLITPQADTSVPILDVSYAMRLCVEHGLTEESCRELLNYLNQVGSILYYSHHPTLAEVLFPVPPFVI